MKHNRYMTGIALLLFTGIVGAVRAEDVILVRGGRPDAVIVTTDSPSPVHLKATEELRTHIRTMSGADLPVVRESDVSDSGAVRIHIGPTGFVRSLGIDTGNLKPEEFVIRSGAGYIVLAGEDGDSRTGTLHAVYDFLQDQFGVRWIWPGEIGTYIPRKKTVAVPAGLNISEAPVLFKRWMRLMLQEQRKDMYRTTGLDEYLDMGETYDALSQDESAWAERMRLGSSGSFSYGHAFTDWWEKYGETHPEIFALQPNGKRGPTGRPDFVKMCVSSPELWELQLERFRQQRVRNAGSHFLNTAENDGSGGFCTCARCRAWDDDPNTAIPGQKVEDGADVDGTIGGTNRPALPQSLSDRYASWYNEMARRTRTIDPDAKVVGYAYSVYREAPKKIERLEPNIIIGVVGFNGYPSTDKQRSYERTQWLGWSDKGATLFLRSNMLFMCAHGAPYIFTHEVTDDWQFLVDHKLTSTDFDCLKGYWATTGPTYYVLARLQWDIHADSDSLFAEYCEAFGPAASVVREYFTYWENFTESLRDNEKFMTSRRNEKILLYPGIYTDKALARGRSILDKAQPLLAGAPSEFRERVRNLELGLEHTGLLVEAVRDGIIGNGPEGEALMRFRRTYASRNVINPYFITYFEKTHGLFEPRQ